MFDNGLLQKIDDREVEVGFIWFSDEANFYIVDFWINKNNDFGQKEKVNISVSINYYYIRQKSRYGLPYPWKESFGRFSYTIQ